MKAKRRKKTKGEDLLDQVIKLTGLPGQTIRRELKTILDKKNIDPSQLTLEQLRAVVASYVREIMGGLLEKTHKNRSETHH